jgi:Rieske Fe-S protein
LPDRRQTQSKYTLDRRIPGAFEGETVSRRRFMTMSVHATGGIAAAAFLLPAVGFAVGPIFEKHKEPWQDVGAPDEFSNDDYTPKTITIAPGIGEPGKSTVYVRKFNPAIDNIPGTRKPDQYDHFIAISTRCMHLGCPIHFVSAAQRFICPCHGGVYDFVGRVAGGPPVRPLDRFYTRVVGGQVQIGPRYSVNEELRRFSPRDPGEPLDGIGLYVYPSRPSIRKLPNT